jgi:hypothetical protein
LKEHVMFIDENFWPRAEPGDPEVIILESARFGPLDGGLPLGLCSHWTAGDYAPDRGHLDSLNLARSIVERPPPKDATPEVIAAARKRGVELNSASWHVLVDKDGTLVVSVPFNRGSWHVGKDGVILGRRRWPNRTLIGIEFENAGRLRSIGGKVYAWPWYENPTAPPEERIPAAKYAVDRGRAVPAKGGLFDAYTPEQERTFEALVRACRARFDFTRAACSFGHKDFDYPRKEDPGPLFDDLRERVLARVYGNP